jgi:hypothetical protein
MAESVKQNLRQIHTPCSVTLQPAACKSHTPGHQHMQLETDVYPDCEYTIAIHEAIIVLY